MSKHVPRIIYVYDDVTENLLNQYKQQLDHHEKIFASKNKDLSNTEFAHYRDLDPVLLSILEVIAKIYDQAIPIAVQIQYEQTPTDVDGPGRGTSH